MATKPKATAVEIAVRNKSQKVGAVIGATIAEVVVRSDQVKTFTKETVVPATKKSFWDIVKEAKASYNRIKAEAEKK